MIRFGGLSDIPLLSKEGWPSDQTVRILGRGGYQGTAKRSLFFIGITNHPVCAVKERDLYISGAATPSFERRPLRNRELNRRRGLSRCE
jgi:hypothetical protein